MVPLHPTETATGSYATWQPRNSPVHKEGPHNQHAALMLTNLSVSYFPHAFSVMSDHANGSNRAPFVLPGKSWWWSQDLACGLEVPRCAAWCASLRCTWYAWSFQPSPATSHTCLYLFHCIPASCKPGEAVDHWLAAAATAVRVKTGNVKKILNFVYQHPRMSFLYECTWE